MDRLVTATDAAIVVLDTDAGISISCLLWRRHLRPKYMEKKVGLPVGLDPVRAAVTTTETVTDDSSPDVSIEAVRELLARLIHEISKVPLERIRPGATIEEELRMESVAFVELQVAIEDYYDIPLDPIRVVELNEFGAIAAYIREQIVATTR